MKSGMTAFAAPKKAYTFDEVFDSQKVFRLVLEASANPGRVIDLAPFAAKMYGDAPGLLALALTFLDNEQRFSTCGDTAFAGQVAALTLSEESPVEEADFIFAGTESAMEEAVEKAKCGTLKDPHKSATLLIRVAGSLGEGTETALAGPGIADTLRLPLPETVRRALALRSNRFFEYPQGIDLWLIDEADKMIALPRLVIREEH